MLVAVGGQSRKVGKSSVVEALIRAVPEAGWVAVKVSPGGPDASRCTVRQETQPGPSGDSARFLAAGARRSYWIQVPARDYRAAVPHLERILAGAPAAIVESDSMVDLLRPDLYLMVVDLTVADLKQSTRRNLSKADAFVLAHPAAAGTRAPDELLQWVSRKPCFSVAPPDYAPPELVEWFRRRTAP